MGAQQQLEAVLDGWASGKSERADVAAAIRAIASAAVDLSKIIGRGGLDGDLAASSGGGGGVAGDTQKALDVTANDILVAALAKAPVRRMLSEEMDAPHVLDGAAPLDVAVDPVDGSSNIETTAPIGTIFSIFPTSDGAPAHTGSAQLAAGYVIYGAQTALVMTVGDGTHLFTLDRAAGQFLLTQERLAIPKTTREVAINASNRRHWDQTVRHYWDDCLAGAEGPRGDDFNMRWIASMVAEAHRILVRGGIYLYPADSRKGYGTGRLRLLYEAHPIAFLVEQAGGAASDGETRILDLAAAGVHQRTPLIFGSADEVALVHSYIARATMGGLQSPLFRTQGRGLFAG